MSNTSFQSAVIYPSQGICTLVSRAWYLFRCNLKTSMMLMLIPTILLTLVSILLSLPGTIPSLTGNSIAGYTISFISLISGIGLMIVSFFAWGYSCCALARVFYSAIVMNVPISLEESLQFLKKIWLSLLLLILVIFLISMTFGILNIVIYVLGIIGSFGLLMSFGFFSTLTHAPNIMVLGMAITVFLLWGFLILSVLLALITIQTFTCLFPFMAVSTSDGKRIPESVFYSFKLLFFNLPKAMIFGCVLFLFSMILSIVFHFPIIIWVTIEMMRLGVDQRMAMPFHINVIFHLWSSLINLFLIPYLIGAVTLFWYDCRVRKEGLDLKLWFQQIVGRKGKYPQDFLSGTTSFQERGTV